VFEKRVLRTIFGPTKEKVTGVWKTAALKFHCMYSLQILLGVFNKIARACGMYTFRPALGSPRLLFHGFFSGGKAAELSS
jgi:hypothetical protein